MNWLRKHRPSPGTAFGFAALMVALGGVAFAAIPDSNGTIHACYEKRGGDLRVVESTDQCRNRRERPISWNREGRPGTSVVARLRGGPVAATEVGTHPIPLSPSSWSQGPNEFQELQVAVRASSILCELRVDVRLDGQLVNAFQFSTADVGTFDHPIFEPGSPTTHTLTVDATPTNFCGETRRGGTIESVKVDVLGFS